MNFRLDLKYILRSFFFHFLYRILNFFFFIIEFQCYVAIVFDGEQYKENIEALYIINVCVSVCAGTCKFVRVGKYFHGIMYLGKKKRQKKNLNGTHFFFVQISSSTSFVISSYSSAIFLIFYIFSCVCRYCSLCKNINHKHQLNLILVNMYTKTKAKS